MWSQTLTLRGRHTQDAASKEERRLTHLASLLLPLRRCTVPDKKGRQPLASHLVAHEIKWKAKDAEHTARLHQQAPELLRIARALQVMDHASSALPQTIVTAWHPAAASGSRGPPRAQQFVLQWCRRIGWPETLSWSRSRLLTSALHVLDWALSSDRRSSSRIGMATGRTCCAWTSRTPSGSSKSGGGSAAPWLPFCRCAAAASYAAATPLACHLAYIRPLRHCCSSGLQTYCPLHRMWRLWASMPPRRQRHRLDRPQQHQRQPEVRQQMERAALKLCSSGALQVL